MITDKEWKNFIESDDTEQSFNDKYVDWKYKDLREKMNGFVLKIKTESYDKGYKAGANQMNNNPCVCGFWGESKNTCHV